MTEKKQPPQGHGWKPGQSGNPKGRPKGSGAVELLRQSSLHILGWNGQQGLVEVNPRPFHLPDVAGALKEQGRERQRRLGHRLAGIAVNGP